MYDLVYRAALNARSKEDLEEKLKQIKGLNINARKKINNRFFTAASKLAYEGKSKQVAWLEELKAVKLEIAIGYAWAGNEDKVCAYHDLFPEILCDIVQAYAEAGNHNQVQKYLRDYEGDPSVVKSVIRGYGISGNYLLMHDILTQQLPGERDHEEALRGLAQGGHHKHVKKYLEEISALKADNANLYLMCVIQGYMKGGYYDKVDQYRINYKIKNQAIVSNYRMYKNIYGGIKEFDNALNQCSLSTMLSSYLKKRTLVVDNQDKTKEYFYKGFFTSRQKSYKQKQEAVEALRDAIVGISVDLTTHLSVLENGRLGKKLKKFIESGRANELVRNKEVKSISEFLEALEEKNKSKNKP
jgi:hypothetical protein